MTAAPFASHLATLKLDPTPSATALTDYSSHVLKVSGKPTDEVKEYYTTDSKHAKQLRGGDMWELSVETPAYSTLHQRALTAMSDSEAPCTGEVYIPDDSTGSMKLTGEWMIQNDGDAFGAEGGKADVNKASFKLKSHGAITVSTVA